MNRIASIVSGALGVLAEAAADIARGRVVLQDVMSQIREIGNRTLPFLIVTMGFFGVIFVFQACFQAHRIIGDLSPVGPAYLQLIIREFGPTIGALMVCTRVAAGIGAQIGTMAVTDQLDALKTCHTRPVELLVVPRLLASVIALPCLAIYASAVAIGAGVATAMLSFAVHPSTFFNFSMVGISDVIIGLLKALAFGVAIPVFAAHAGLTTSGGSNGVGAATTAAVVHSSIAIIVLDFIGSSVGYLVT